MSRDLYEGNFKEVSSVFESGGLVGVIVVAGDRRQGGYGVYARHFIIDFVNFVNCYYLARELI